MGEIQNMDEVTCDQEFYKICCQLMMFKPTREMFVLLRVFEKKKG